MIDGRKLKEELKELRTVKGITVTGVLVAMVLWSVYTIICGNFYSQTWNMPFVAVFGGGLTFLLGGALLSGRPVRRWVVAGVAVGLTVGLLTTTILLPAFVMVMLLVLPLSAHRGYALARRIRSLGEEKHQSELSTDIMMGSCSVGPIIGLTHGLLLGNMAVGLFHAIMLFALYATTGLLTSFVLNLFTSKKERDTYDECLNAHQ